MHPKTDEAHKFDAATRAQPLREDVRRDVPFAGMYFEQYPGEPLQDLERLTRSLDLRPLGGSKGVPRPARHGGPGLASGAFDQADQEE